MQALIDDLVGLRKDFGAMGIKQSFEDEGVTIDDVVLVNQICLSSKAKTFVKIGGCEAKSDFNTCLRLGISNIIAPMVESEFALSKFLDLEPYSSSKYIVIETKTTIENFDSILQSGHEYLSGIILGRNDLSKSYGISDCDSPFIFDKAKYVFEKSKQLGLKTTLGGSISRATAGFIQDLYSAQLLDRFETRNVVFELSCNNINNIDILINEALKFEINLLDYKQTGLQKTLKTYQKRTASLLDRI